MRNFLSVAPGAVWTAIILGLTLGAMFLNDYMGDVVPVWLPPLILTVIVPMLRVFFPDAEPVGRAADAPGVPQRSAFVRWLGW